MSFIGDNSKQLVRNESSYIHGQGWTTLHEYHGREQELEGILWEYVDKGWEVRTNRDPPYMRFTATRGGDEQTAQTDYYDKFSITKETLQKSIWTLPEVVANVAHFGSDEVNSGLGLSYYKKTIEEAVSTAQMDTMIGDFGPDNGDPEYATAWSVYRELCRGADSYETEYIVLARERVVSLEYFQTDVMPIPEANASIIYPSTDALKNAFDIPNFAAVTWPDATPPASSGDDLQWGWRSRRREIRFQEGARVEVAQDWVYAEWSTNLYTPQP